MSAIRLSNGLYNSFSPQGEIVRYRCEVFSKDKDLDFTGYSLNYPTITFRCNCRLKATNTYQLIWEWWLKRFATPNFSFQYPRVLKSIFGFSNFNYAWDKGSVVKNELINLKPSNYLFWDESLWYGELICFGIWNKIENTCRLTIVDKDNWL